MSAVILPLLEELLPLKLRGTPRRGDLVKIAGIWSASLSRYSADEIQTAIRQHLRRSGFFPQLNEISEHLPDLESVPDDWDHEPVKPTPADQVSRLNEILGQSGIDRVVKASGSALYAEEAPPSLDTIRARLLQRPNGGRLWRRWSAVLSGARWLSHRGAVVIHVPSRAYADWLASDLLEELSAALGCKCALFSD